MRKRQIRWRSIASSHTCGHSVQLQRIPWVNDSYRIISNQTSSAIILFRNLYFDNILTARDMKFIWLLNGIYKSLQSAYKYQCRVRLRRKFFAYSRHHVNSLPRNLRFTESIYNFLFFFTRNYFEWRNRHNVSHEAYYANVRNILFLNSFERSTFAIPAVAC